MLLWQAARWVKAKFDVDIAIGSTGLFSASDVTVRVNQLQTVVSLQYLYRELLLVKWIKCFAYNYCDIRLNISLSAPEMLI